MEQAIPYAAFDGRILMVGFGSIGSAALPLLLRHFDIDPRRIHIVAADSVNAAMAEQYGVCHEVLALDAGNYETVLDRLVRPGDFLLNLSVDVSSLELVRYCWRHGVLYLDTCIEPWAGRYTDPTMGLSRRSNYALREEMLAFRRDKRDGPTAVVTQGANPGLVAMLVKQALLDMARHTRQEPTASPSSPGDWAQLARQLGIKAIHIAERDTQSTGRCRVRGEFVNTWSVPGFVAEGLQPAELGWGSHERSWPEDAERHGYGSDAAIYLRRPAVATRVRSWTPLEGPYQGLLVTQGESISIADHLTLREDDRVVYRPTVHAAYQPCDDALLSLLELADKNWRLPDRQRVLRDDIVQGMDELGVLLMGHPAGVFWLGSRLTIEEARALAPHHSATSLQVVAGILAGMVWALRNPRRGVVEPEDLDHESTLAIAKPYLGDLVGVWADWTPLHDRSPLYAEDIDTEDPWQFVNFRVR